jgi:proton-translocating NADH-quinone oxidoreductase chain N
MTPEMDMARDLGLLLPQIVVLLTAIAALIAGMVHRHRWALPVTLIGLAAATVLTVPLIADNTTVFMGTYRIDNLSLWATLILVPTTAMIAILVKSDVRGTDREATVFSLLSLTTLGALVLSGVGDIMFLVLGVLLTGLGAFALVAYPRTDRATEAAIKYFVFGAVSGAVMTYGLTFWFGATGSTLLTDLQSREHARLAIIGGLIAVLIGLGYKAALVPFHFWAPDAYDGAPLAVAAYLSVVTKIGAIFALAQVMRSLPEAELEWRPVVAIIAVVSMTYGNLAALPQTNLVRLLAYSSIAQSGYFLVGLVGLGASDLAVRALIVFGAAYAAMNLGAFAVVAAVGRDLSRFQGIGRSAPWIGGGMVVFLLSLVGVPPFAGFFGKLLLFSAAIDAGYAWLAVVAILNSVLSLGVYLRIVVPMYQPARLPVAAPRATRIVWGTGLAVTMVIGVGSELLLRAIS